MKFFWILLLLAGSAFAGALDDFFVAIKQDDTRTVTNLLFRGFDPNSVDARGYTGLLYAAREGSLKVATLLLSQNKTLVEARTPQDENVLMMAALAGHEQRAGDQEAERGEAQRQATRRV